jgi:hypothetical protein
MAKNLHEIGAKQQRAFGLMTPHFRAYVSNLNRVRLAELLDHHAIALRHGRARPSLIVNPLSGYPYPGKAADAQDLQGARASTR